MSLLDWQQPWQSNRENTLTQRAPWWGTMGSHPGAAEGGIILSAAPHHPSESPFGSLWHLPTLFPHSHVMAWCKLGICKPDPTHELMPATAPEAKSGCVGGGRRSQAHEHGHEGVGVG